MTDEQGVGDGPPPTPPVARRVFGDRLPQAEAFARALADTGVAHGLIGPSEMPRLWDRHILNCAVIHDAFPEGATVIDVGSGAGLPGVAVAIARPDLDLHLVEPMLRRTAWLSRVVADLGMANCTVHRGRADEYHGRLRAPFVTARAVARIDKLARWTFPLLGSEGTLVAMKGRSALEELEAERAGLTRLGMVDAVLSEHGVGVLDKPTLTLDLRVRRGGAAASASRRRAAHTRPRRSRSAR
jgi:16S rRNA (guanine527-N7)-methyltransferase